MDLEKLLKQFKTIEPDPSFARISKQTILGGGRREARTAWRLLLEGLQFGGALTLAAALLVLLLGGISALRILRPPELSGLNPTSLRAEADAIEFQIQLTDVIYRESGEVAAPPAPPEPQGTSGESQRPSEDAATSSALRVITIDEALELLAE